MVAYDGNGDRAGATAMILPVYVLGKYLGYSIWCYLGLRWLRGKNSAGAAMAFGSVRLGLGIIFGVAIFVIGGILHLNAPANSWFVYLAVYVPVRYVEWSILAAVLGTQGGQIFQITGAATQRWILGGIIVSHLADLPLIFYGGEGPKAFLPVGRFLC